MPEAITLDMNSLPVQYLCKKDKRLAKVISMVGPITYKTHAEDPYAFLIHEIIEQMLSVKAGAKIYSRLETLCNGNISPESVNCLTDSEIKSIGTADSKVLYIRSLTNAVMNGELQFESLVNMKSEDVFKKLTSIRGIGNWTAKMYLLFVLDHPDILPFEDVAFLQTYEWMYKTKDRSRESVCKKCTKWKPYSSTAARFMYRALDMGLTKEEFHLYK